MPIDALSSWTYEEHLLELTDRVGLALRSGSQAEIPSGALLQDKAKRWWNVGYQKFLMADPNWSFAREEVTLTLDSTGAGPLNLDGSAARYKLPAYCVGTPASNWRFVDESACYTAVQNMQYELVDRKRQQSAETTGTPAYAGHYQMPGDGIDEGPVCWAVLFWPTPDQAYTLRATYRTTKHRLRLMGERTVAGGDHDPTILAFALCEWGQNDEALSARVQTWERERVALLQASVELDKKRRTRKLGQLPIVTGAPMALPGRSLNVLVNDIPITTINLQE